MFRFQLPAPSRQLLLFSGLVALLGEARAQTLCSIDLGADHTICQGETVTLNGPPGFTNHLWSTGATTPNITVSTPGNYWCQVSYPTGELVTNGDFSMGNMGFSSAFSLSPTLTTDGNYWIGTNAAVHHPQFVGTGNGQFLMVNAGWMHAGFEAWCQTHPVCPGQTYALTFRAVSLAAQGAPTLQWYVDGQPTFINHQTVLPQGNWQTFTTNWTAPTGTTQANFCLRVTSGHGVGNDFGIDDISISATIVLTDQVQVFVTPLPSVDLGPNATLCEGQSLMLDAGTPGATYLWQDGSTLPDLLVTTAGNYAVTVTANGCSAADAIQVNFNPLPVVDLGDDLALCEGQTVTLNVAQPNTSYVWHDGSNAASYTVTAAGTYAVTATLNGCTATDDVEAIYDPLPVFDLGPAQVLCAGQQVTLDATTPGATYLWQDGSGSATYTASTTGNYSATVTVNGCSTSDAVSLTFTPLPSMDLGPTQNICPGTNVVLNATVPGGTYLWQDGSVAATYVATQAGTYSVTVTANGCSSFDAVEVNLLPAPTVDLGADPTFCQGGEAILDATFPGATYLWTTGDITPTITATQSGMYGVAVTLGSCTETDGVLVTVTPLPTIELGADPALCPGDSWTLDATMPGATYSWNTGATTAQLTVTDPGPYEVTVTLNGCSASDAVNATAFTPTSVDLGPDITLCSGGQATLAVNLPGASFLWSTGATTPQVTVSTAGQHWVQVTQGTCMVSDSVQVEIITPGALELGPPQVLCDGESVTLDATLPGADYLWNTGATTPTLTVDATDNYSVTVTVGPCVLTDAVEVTITPLPVVDLGPDQNLCPGSTVTFNATTPDGTYAWHDGSTGPTYQTGQAEAVSVTVTVNGCSASDGASAIAVEAPVADLGADAILCAGDALTLDVTQPGGSYLWDDGSSEPNRTVNTTGTYWVQVTRNGCVATDTIEVSVFDPTTVDLGPDQQLCPGETAVLSVNAPGGTVQWSTGSTAPTISVSTAGTYWVYVQLATCAAQDTVLITAVDLVPPDLGADRTICQGDSTELRVEPGDASVLWSTGSTGPAITVATAGSYGVTLQLLGCSASDVVLLSVTDRIDTLDLGDTRRLCLGSMLRLEAPVVEEAIYFWSDGSGGSFIEVIEPGTYTVSMTGTCVDASGMVLVEAGDCGPFVHVPNAFTPNGDGINDRFAAQVGGDVYHYSLDIFDRWGVRLLSLNDPTLMWDGKVNGADAPDGVYVWVLNYHYEADQGRRSERSMGHVTLLR